MINVPERLYEALANIDWQQVMLNGGPPCFFIEGTRFCLRAERWQGHGYKDAHAHQYTTLWDVLYIGSVEQNKPVEVTDLQGKTVAELIEILKKYPPSYTIHIYKSHLYVRSL